MKNITNKITTILITLLSFAALFIPSLASATGIDLGSTTSSLSYPSYAPYYYGVPKFDNNNRATGVKYYCKFVDEKSKTIKSDNLYDDTTLSRVQKLLDEENNNIKSIKNGEFKPSTKSLSCKKNSDLDGYAITPIEFSCRTLDDNNKVLDNKNYNIVQVLNNVERVDAENAALANKKAKSTNSLPKKQFQCVNVGETYDIFDGKAENNAKHSQQTDAWSHIKNVSKFMAFGIIGFITSIIVIVILVARCKKHKK